MTYINKYFPLMDTSEMKGNKRNKLERKKLESIG